LSTNPSTISLAPFQQDERANRRRSTIAGVACSAFLAIILASTPFTPRLPPDYRLVDFGIVLAFLLYLLGLVVAWRLPRPLALELNSEGLVLAYPMGVLRRIPWSRWPGSISILVFKAGAVRTPQTTLSKLVLSGPLRHSFWIPGEAADRIASEGIRAGLSPRIRGYPLLGLYGKSSVARELVFRKPPGGAKLELVGHPARP
jgi:hypothetical protein